MVQGALVSMTSTKEKKLMALQMILGGGEDAKPLIEAAHAEGLRTVVVDLPAKITVAGMTDLACYLDPLDADAVEVMARQLQVSSVVATTSSRASTTEAVVVSRLKLV